MKQKQGSSLKKGKLGTGPDAAAALQLQIIASMDRGIISLDRNLRCTSWNAYMESLTGKPASKALGRLAWQLMPAVKPTVMKQMLRRALKGASIPAPDRLYARSRKSRAHWLTETYSPVRNHLGRITGILWILTDISDRKRCELTLAAREAKLRSIFETSSEGIMMVDSRSKIIFANQRMADMLGYTLVEMFKHPRSHFVAKEELPDFRKKTTSVRKGMHEIFERKFRRKDGSILYGLVSTASQFDAAGRYKGSIAMVTDISSRKQAENILRQNEEKFRKIFEEAQTGITTLNPDFTFNSANRAFCSMIGYSEQELRALTFKEITHPEDLKSDLINIAKLAAGELEFYRCETRYIHKDGHHVWGSLAVSTVRSNQGTLEYFLAMIKDTTESRKAEAALKDAAQRIREERDKANQYIDNAGSIMVVLDRTLRVLLINRTGCEILGYPKEQIEGRHWVDSFVPERMRGQITRRLEELAAGRLEGVSHGEGVIVTKSGVERVIAWHNNILRNAAGTPTSILSSGTDMTERIRTEHILRESEKRFRALVNSMTEGMALHELIFNASGDPVNYRILSVNPSYQTHTGIGNLSAIGALGTTLYGTEPPPYLDIFARVAMTGEPHKFETVFPPLSKHFRISVFSPGKGFFATVFEDITREKRLESQIRTMNEQLEAKVKTRTEELTQINKELEAFIHAVSHDLRGPIHTISSCTDVLKEDYAGALDEEGRKYLNFVHEGAWKMGGMLDGLLELSHCSKGEVSRKQFSLSEMAEEVATELRIRHPVRNVLIRIQQGVQIRGDERLIRNLLNNLIGNAWKYTNRRMDAMIEVGCTTAEGETVYYVRDNGAGFNMEHADKLFSPFKRLHSRDEFDGTGMGLATAKRIIARHGGRIWAEGAVDKGATFYFTLGN